MRAEREADVIVGERHDVVRKNILEGQCLGTGAPDLGIFFNKHVLISTKYWKSYNEWKLSSSLFIRIKVSNQ